MMETDSPAPGPASASLQFRGGIVGLFLPFLVMVAGILWLGLTGLAIPEAFWPFTILAVFVGLLLVRDQQAYVNALIAGTSSSMLSIMLMAWFLAGILGRLLAKTGIIEGLVWLALQLDLSAGWFPLVTFFISAGLSLSTGTSIGTILAATPILFPAGFALGADPLLMLGAIIGGAFVGDNLAPISDTTIVSAYSQGTDVGTVVRTRIRYALVAGAVTLLAYVTFGLTGGEPRAAALTGIDVRPAGLVMLLVPIVLMIMTVRGHHLIPALLYSLAFGILLGLLRGLMTPVDLLAIDPEQFVVKGIVVEGITGMVGIAVFTIFLMGLIGTLEAGGMVQWMMNRAERLATTVTRAEVSIVGITLMLNALTGAGTPSMVMLGPFVRRLGHRFRITPWRRGNLLDACSTSIIGFLPWSVAVLIPFAMVADTVRGAALVNFTPVHLIPYVFYPWALMLVMIAAAITGWGRDLMTAEESAREARELYGDEQAVRVAAANG
jgi:Na+/H+ antiporter NhaC